MKYTVTKEETIEVDVTGKTLYAISLFEKYHKLEEKADKVWKELNEVVLTIPDEDFKHYVRMTDEIMKKYPA